MGSDGSAASGGRSDRSEWQRSKFRERTANRKFRVPQQGDSLDLGECLTPGISRAKYRKICGCGGIGRLIGFRFQRASVQVRVLSSAPKKRHPLGASFLVRIRTRTYLNATRMSVAGEGLTEPHNNVLESCHPRKREKHPTGCLFFGADKDSNLSECDANERRRRGLDRAAQQYTRVLSSAPNNFGTVDTESEECLTIVGKSVIYII